MNTLWYKLNHRTHTLKVHDNGYHYDTTHTNLIFNVISQHIMWNYLNMDYYWSYKGKIIGFIKMWNINKIL